MVKESSAPETSSAPTRAARSAKAAKHKKRSFYPSSRFDPQTVSVRSEDYGLVQVLEEICRCEEQALRDVFSRGESCSDEKESANKQAVHDALCEVLRSLPVRVQEGLREHPEERDFQPEQSLEERERVAQRQRRLAALQRQSQQLDDYLADPHTLREQLNLWMGAAPPLQVPVTSSEHVETTAQRYVSILTSIESSCDDILSLTKACQTDMQASRQIQEKLYDEYNALRAKADASVTVTASASAAPVPVSVPKDPKDLLRALPKFFSSVK